jgi:hypothetical protein
LLLESDPVRNVGHHPSGFWPESLLNSAQRYHEPTVHIARALAALFPAEQVVAAPLKITRTWHCLARVAAAAGGCGFARIPPPELNLSARLGQDPRAKTPALRGQRAETSGKWQPVGWALIVFAASDNMRIS